MIFGVVALYFFLFLIIPAGMLLGKSFLTAQGIGIHNYVSIFSDTEILGALANSFLVSAAGAFVTTFLAFLLAFAVHYTRLPGWLKASFSAVARLPMFLPTITYGFAILYSFGKQGLLTKLFGRQLFEIYGFNGLLVGYVIYTLPVSFMLIENTMHYIDKSFSVVSRLLYDNPLKNFYMTVFLPVSGALVSSFIQTFFLCFTDFGIPAAVGGRFQTIAGVLYQEMLGSVPDFGRGAVIALMMLLPSVISVTVLHELDKHNVRYNKVSELEMKKSLPRDVIFGVLGVGLCVAVLAVFAVIFVIPFVGNWPYDIRFTVSHFQDVWADSALMLVMKNSLIVSVCTALVGTLAAYGCALITARSQMPGAVKKMIEAAAMVTNTIPGMVLGLAYLFVFSGSFLQGTLVLLVLCNVIHYFSTPYLMMKASLSKLNASWETTAMLMGDSWLRTVLRVVTPNTMPTLLEVFGYYFINAMVTISAVIFIAGARTMVVTTKFKELQYYNKYSEIFVLSLFILLVNLVSRLLVSARFSGFHKKKKAQ